MQKARRARIRELLQMANIDSMDDIQNLFRETIAEFMENGLEAELNENLGYSKYDYKNKVIMGLSQILCKVQTAIKQEQFK